MAAARKAAQSEPRIELMKHTLGLIVATISLGNAPVLAQRIEPVNSLGRAKSTFEAADVDKNGQVTFGELTQQKLAIQRADFAAIDADKDGLWSREEFYVYYRRLLINSGQRAADDLESEVARIQAVRHAKAAALEAKRQPPKVLAPAISNTDAGLKTALDELEKRAAAGQATREEFQMLRAALIERARLDNANDPATAAELVAKFEAALTVLETQAKEGRYNRDEYAALRALMIGRVRAAATVAVVTTPVATVTQPTVGAPFELALDDLSKNAEARRATAEDFQRLRAAWAARVRPASTDAAAVARDAELDQKFTRAMEALERDARSGKYSREQFEELRAAYISRARFAAGSTPVVPTAPVVAPAAPNSASGPEASLDTALDDLSKKAEAKQATEDDFRRVRETWIARSRAAAQSSDPASIARQATLEEQFTRAFAALEQDARAGKYSREQFQALRDSYIARARYAAAANAAQTTPAPAPEAVPPAVTPSPETLPAANPPAPVESPEETARRFDEALQVFEQRVLAHGASRADFQRVYDMLVGRARAAVAAQAGTAVADSDPRLAVLITRLQGVLGRLERTMSNGAGKSEEFAFLREAAQGRVREIPPEQPAPSEEKRPADESTKPAEAPKPVDAPMPDESVKSVEQPKQREQVKPTEPAQPAEPAKRGEVAKTEDAVKSADNPSANERVRPAPAPAPEAPKPVDPPKVEDRSKERERPATPPHAAQRSVR